MQQGYACILQFFHAYVHWVSHGTGLGTVTIALAMTGTCKIVKEYINKCTFYVIIKVDLLNKYNI